MESCGIVEPSAEDLTLSTVSLVKPLRELSRSRGSRVGSRQKELNVVQLLSQVNEQFGKTENLEEFYRVSLSVANPRIEILTLTSQIVAGVFKELTEFDRTMIYQFDDSWNGRGVAEQVCPHHFFGRRLFLTRGWLGRLEQDKRSVPWS